MGTYALNEGSITIQPGRQSDHFSKARRSPSATARSARSRATAARIWTENELERQLITGLSEGQQHRTKRRWSPLTRLPANLVNAVTSIQRSALSLSMAGSIIFGSIGVLLVTTCAWAVGGRGVDPRPCSLHADLPYAGEVLKAVNSLDRDHLSAERRFTKLEISFSSTRLNLALGQHGQLRYQRVGQAAQSTLAKTWGRLDLAQCALLAGMIQHPSFLNRYRHRNGPSHAATGCSRLWSKPARSPRRSNPGQG